IEQRTKQWGEEKALKFISHLNENIEKGQIVEVQKGRAAIKTDLTTIILDKKENNNFVLTAFRDRNNKKELESLNLSQSKTFTSENAEANAKESPVTSLNQESIIAQNAKNDEVLEAEVIEEVGLNEPMKFLEFQQRKLLTYIKENTPLRLLEHKKELKTRDILNFLEQSALNGKQKVFLMRNLERDLEKLEAQLKEAEEVGFKEAKNAVDDDFLKGYDEKIKQNIKSLEFENELIENPRPRGREPQDRYISLAYFMANFAQHYKLLDLKNPRTKEQIELLENALKKQNIGYEVLENEPVAIRYFKKEGVKRQGAKQKTINKVDEYAKSEEFKALSEDKQEAILSLKNLEPSIMPSEISKDNLENILKHFNSKQDKARREFYAKLFNDTKENPHIVLEVKRENELRQEYIKAYQHKDTHDLYYIAITKDKDTINVTGYPITKIKDVINQIKNAEKVVWRQQGDQTHTALVSKETQNLESVNESIAQNSQEAKIKEAIEENKKQTAKLFDEVIRQENKPSVKPLDEFGINFEGFKGKEAIEKLLEEQRGQVKGAFYKEGLGEIDLVWGDSKKGLSHILERKTQDFINQGLEKGKAEYKVRELLSEIPQILENGKILSQNNDKIELITDKYTLVLGLREDKKFIVTELIDKRNKKRLEAMQTGVGDSFTDEPLAKTPLSQNQQEIIPQQKIKFAMEKFHFDEAKAKDLLEWHKNSHALTKDENGLPKVFYHGTYSKFRVFRRVGKASGQGFFFTPSQKATEEYGDITLNTFLNIKNPFRADELKINKEADLQKWADILKLDYDKEKYESFKDLKTKLEKVKEATKKAGFKFHSASGGSVYVIDNKGRNSFINLEELDKENKRVVEAFKGLETEDIYFYHVVRNEFDLVLYALNKNDRYFH
ncbi:hypothetical protein WGZ40_001741, partial [Campylobacter upsaliensis]